MTLIILAIFYSVVGAKLAATNKMKMRVEELGSITNNNNESWE